MNVGDLVRISPGHPVNKAFRQHCTLGEIVSISRTGRIIVSWRNHFPRPRGYKAKNLEVLIERCPNCGELAMPRWVEGSKEQARACQKCGHVQEKTK